MDIISISSILEAVWEDSGADEPCKYFVNRNTEVIYGDAEVWD